MLGNRGWLVLVGWLAVLPARAQAPVEKLLPADRPDGPPVVTARAWAVAEGKTGKLLWGSQEAEPLAIASTTKIMTAWIVFQLAADNRKILEEPVTRPGHALRRRQLCDA